MFSLVVFSFVVGGLFLSGDILMAGWNRRKLSDLCFFHGGLMITLHPFPEQVQLQIGLIGEGVWTQFLFRCGFGGGWVVELK